MSTQTKKLSKDSIMGLVRQGLTFLAAWLAAYTISVGEILTASIPAIVAVILTVWGWLDKSNRDLNVWYSFSRHVLSIAGGFVLGFQVIAEDTWNNIVSGLLGMVSIILSMVDNAKSK